MDEEKSRLEQFKEFVELDPTDIFSRYALAMEYLGAEQYQESIMQFQEVLKLDSTYSAAYFQASIASRKNDQIAEARDYLVRGIEVADKKGDRHARDEMKQALEDLDDFYSR